MWARRRKEKYLFIYLNAYYSSIFINGTSSSMDWYRYCRLLSIGRITEIEGRENGRIFLMTRKKKPTREKKKRRCLWVNYRSSATHQIERVTRHGVFEMGKLDVFYTAEKKRGEKTRIRKKKQNVPEIRQHIVVL